MGFKIAKILKPHGVYGELKAEAYLDTLSQYKSVKEVSVADARYKVLGIRGSDAFVFFRLENINSQEQAEALRGKEICVDDTAKPPLPEGKYYISDLIGCEVFSGEKSIGKLTNVLQTGSADIYCGEHKGKRFMFPALKKVIISTDIKKKTVILNEKTLSEVIVYED